MKCNTAPSTAVPTNASGTKPSTWTEGSSQPLTCDTGYHGTITLACATAGGEYTLTGTCAANECTCTNGTAATNAACTTHNANICSACTTTGYELVTSTKTCAIKCDTAPSAAVPTNASGTKPSTWTEGSVQPITCATGYSGTITLACATAGGEYTITGTCAECAENYHVDANKACAPCTGGSTRPAGDPTAGSVTQCNTSVCRANFYLQDLSP